MAQGLSRPGLSACTMRLRRSFAEELGAGFAAVRDGEVVVDLWGGWADRAQTRPWAHDTIVPVYSTTKGVSALVLALLADKRALRLRGAARFALARVRRARQGSRHHRAGAGASGRRAGLHRTDRSRSLARSRQRAPRRSPRLRRCGRRAAPAAIIRSPGATSPAKSRCARPGARWGPSCARIFARRSASIFRLARPKASTAAAPK